MLSIVWREFKNLILLPSNEHINKERNNLLNIKFNQRWKAIIFSFLISTVFIWFSLYPPAFAALLLERLNYLAYDLRLNFQIQPHQKPKNFIVIVDIDEKSLQAEGRWPWSRQKLSELVKDLYQQGVTVIAFDMIFPETEPNADHIFAHTLAASQNKSVLGVYFSPLKRPDAGILPMPSLKINVAHIDLPDMQSYTANIPLLQNAAGQGGAISVTPDKDGVIRHYNLLQHYKNFLYTSLALEAVRVYLLKPPLSIMTSRIGQMTVIDAIKLGNEIIATDEQGRIFIPYLGPSRTFKYYSATDILHHALAPDELKNALVFLGTSAVGLGDIRSTPVESVFPGVEIHANVAEALLTDHFPFMPAWIPGAQFFLLICLSLSLSLIYTRVGPLWIISTSFLLMIVIFFASILLWQYTQIVFPIVLAMALIGTLAIFNMTYGFFMESKRRDELKKVFEQYVPSGHVDEILKNPKAFDVFEGERKTLSVLFMDIRGFTTISEKLTIIELKKLLNFFLTEMTRVIFEHDGTVDKYVGDMIMAFWGAPLKDELHSQHALMTALDMIKTAVQLQKTLSHMQLPPVQIGIGVNTGVMDVGDMGSTYRRAYTVLGDAVNLASRLESLTKYYGVNIICGENTVSNFNQYFSENFIFRLLDKVKVKGKNKGVCIYEPIGIKAELDEKLLSSLNNYQQALNAYFSKDFVRAKILFLKLTSQFSENVLYKIYLARIEKFLLMPPAENWDGLWEHHEK